MLGTCRLGLLVPLLLAPWLQVEASRKRPAQLLALQTALQKGGREADAQRRKPSRPLVLHAAPELGPRRLNVSAQPIAAVKAASDAAADAHAHGAWAARATS